MSLIKAIKQQLGLSVADANNFTWDASADDGTMKLVRNSGEVIMTVSAAGVVAFPQTPPPAVNYGSSGELALTGLLSVDAVIPAGARRVTVLFKGASLSGTQSPVVRLGVGGVLQSTGYNSASGNVSTTPNTTSGYVSASGFTLGGATATNVYDGMVELVKSGVSNTWAAAINVALATSAISGGGNVTLTGELDIVRITNSAGTGTYDAGTAEVLWEL